MLLIQLHILLLESCKDKTNCKTIVFLTYIYNHYVPQSHDTYRLLFEEYWKRIHEDPINWLKKKKATTKLFFLIYDWISYTTIFNTVILLNIVFITILEI